MHDDLLQRHEEQHQRAGDDLAPPGGERAVEGDQGRDDGLEQHAEERADHVADAAGEQHAADDRGGDDVQLAALQRQVPAGLDVQRVRDARQRGAEAVEAVDHHLRLIDRQAHQARGLLVAADGVDVAAKAGLLQDDGADDDHDDEDHDVQVDVGDGLDLDPFTAGVLHEVHLPAGHLVNQLVVDGDGLAADEGAHAARQEHARQRCDKRGDLEVGDQRAHAQAQQHADQDGERHAQHRIKTQHGGAVGDEHAGEGGDRRDGQVDAAGDEHHRHAHGGDADVGVVHEEHHERAQLGEAAVAVHEDARAVNDQEDADGGEHHEVLRVGDEVHQLAAFLLIHGAHLPSACGPGAWPATCRPAQTG